jgi:hypothetical protein
MYASVCREQHIVDQLPEKIRRYVGLAHGDCEARKERVCTWLAGEEGGGGKNIYHIEDDLKITACASFKAPCSRTLPA